MDALVSFDGSLLVVSHDRFFLDHVVDEVLGLEDGRATDFAGSVSSLLERRKLALEASGTEADTKSTTTGSGDDAAGDRPKEMGISKNELQRARRRLNEVERKIEYLENEHQELVEQLEDPDIYRNVEQLKLVKEGLSEVETMMDRLMKEWEGLQETCM